LPQYIIYRKQALLSTTKAISESRIQKEIWGLHGAKNLDCGLLGYDACVVLQVIKCFRGMHHLQVAVSHMHQDTEKLVANESAKCLNDILPTIKLKTGHKNIQYHSFFVLTHLTIVNGKHNIKCIIIWLAEPFKLPLMQNK
jgi:hypothetical protein